MQSSLVTKRDSSNSNGQSNSTNASNGIDPNPELHQMAVQRHVNMTSAFKLGRLKFIIHPQPSVFSYTKTTTVDHPSGQSGAQFLQRFRLQDQEQEFSKKLPGNAPSSGMCMPVYREKAIKSKISARLDGKDPVVQFSLYYDMLLSRLTIQLHHVVDLPMVRGKGRRCMQCDPFATLHLEPDRGDTLQTEVVKNSHSPTFNQTFQFGGLLFDYLKHQTLVFQVYNYALNSRGIGRACLPLNDAELFGVIIQMKVTLITEEMEV